MAAILFIHQNFPGQYKHLAPALKAMGHDCRVLTDLTNKNKTSLETWRYKFEPRAIDPKNSRLGTHYTGMADRGAACAHAARRLRDDIGFSPDLIIGHTGWGETLFLKEVWPDAKILAYCEFFYSSKGVDTGFDTEFGRDNFEKGLRTVSRTAYMTQAMAYADLLMAPTRWQASTFPPVLQRNMRVIFDGVDTNAVTPNPEASFELPDGQVLHAGDEVLTFVNRNLEPYRGYHIFMRMLPAVLRARPNARVVIVGADGVSYGPPPSDGRSWKETLLAEVGHDLDLSRVHFVGYVAYQNYLQLLQISRAHVYMTYPFVLSWSMVEAMSAGCLVIGSRTPPVEEMIVEGKTGLLVDFFDVQGWSAQVIEALAEPEKFDAIRRRARRFVQRKYDLNTVCLPEQIAMITAMLPDDTPASDDMALATE